MNRPIVPAPFGFVLCGNHIGTFPCNERPASMTRITADAGGNVFFFIESSDNTSGFRFDFGFITTAERTLLHRLLLFTSITNSSIFFMSGERGRDVFCFAYSIFLDSSSTIPKNVLSNVPSSCWYLPPRISISRS